MAAARVHGTRKGCHYYTTLGRTLTVYSSRSRIYRGIRACPCHAAICAHCKKGAAPRSYIWLSPCNVICYNGDGLDHRHNKRNTRYMENAILGGGALGLMAAYRLAKAGQPVMGLVQETTAGGLAAGFRAGDTWLEKVYNHLFRRDTYAIKIIEELVL